MRPKKETIWLLSVTMILAMAVSTQEAASAPPENRQTARAALDKAIAKAKAWKADAQLTVIAAKVNDKGQADNNAESAGDGWAYIFDSVAAKRSLSVQVYRGGLEALESEPVAAQMIGSKFLPQTFVDSDQVIAEARKNGFSAKGGSISMSLADQPRGLSESFVWTVGSDDGTVFFMSAKSGKFLAKI